MKKENKKSVKKEKKEEKIGNGFGIAGFVCSVLFFLLLFILKGHYRLLPFCLLIHIVLWLLGLIFSIIQLKRKKTKLAVAGLIISILTLTPLFMIIYDFMPDTFGGGNFECTKAKLTLVQANSLDNTVKLRRNAGGADVNITSIKIIISTPGAERDIAAKIISPPKGKQSIGELETITYTVSDDIKAGDTVNIAAIVLNSKGTNTVCNIASSKKAV